MLQFLALSTTYNKLSVDLSLGLTWRAAWRRNEALATTIHTRDAIKQFLLSKYALSLQILNDKLPRPNARIRATRWGTTHFREDWIRWTPWRTRFHRRATRVAGVLWKAIKQAICY